MGKRKQRTGSEALQRDRGHSAGQQVMLAKLFVSVDALGVGESKPSEERPAQYNREWHGVC